MTSAKSPAQSPLPRLESDNGFIAFPAKSEQVFYDLELRLVSESQVAGTSGFWLLRAESGLAGLVPADCTIYRDGKLVSGLAILHEEDRITIGVHSLRFREIGEEEAAGSCGLSGERCGLCSSVFGADTAIRRCPLCGRGYCTTCWGHRSMQRCGSPFCRFSPAFGFDRND